MRKNYLKFSVIAAVLSSAVLIASITPPATINYVTNQQSAETIANIAPAANIITKNISEANINKTGITWPNDLLAKYAATTISWKQSQLLNITNGTANATLSKNGFTWRTSPLSLTSVLYALSLFPTTKVNFNLFGQTFSNGLYANKSNFITQEFEFPTATQYSVTNFTLAKDKPFFKVSTFSEENVHLLSGQSTFCQYDYSTSSTSHISHASLDKTLFYTKSILLGYTTNVYEFKWSVFNDYDYSGALAKTFIQSFPFKTELQSIDVDETLLDKTKTVLDQNLDFNNLVSIAAKDLPLNILNTAVSAKLNPDLGSIDFELMPKQVFGVNGEIALYTGSPIVKTVKGFRISDIKAKDVYPTTVQVQELMSILNPNNVVNPKELQTYLNLTSIPDNTNYEIQANPTYDYKLGKITFNIRMSRYFNNNSTTNTIDLITTPSVWISITLTLSPRLTSIITRTDYTKIRVDKLKDTVFETSGVAKIAEIKQFINISGAVDGGLLYLKPNSYVIDTSMGTAQFTVFYDKYYALDGTLKIQDVTNVIQSFDVSLQLFPLASVISLKTNYVATHRVDRFISTFTDADGNVTDESILKQYVDLLYLPIGYTLKVNNVMIIDSLVGTISFDIFASKYNDVNLLPQVNGTFSIRLLKLLPKYPTTKILAKAEGSYDKTIRVDRFIQLFTDSNGAVTNLTKLSEFLDILSLPVDVAMSVNNVVIVNATGKITFDIVIDMYYDVNSDLQIKSKSFSIILNLGIKYLPTKITTKTDGYPERIDRFETKLKELSGTSALQGYLQTKYISISGDLPKNSIFSVTNIVADATSGIINFDLIVSDYYDENSDLQKLKTFALTLKLRIKYYSPTVLTAKAKADYTANERVDRFAHTVQMFKNDDLRRYLTNYVDGISTLPAYSALVATNIMSDNKTGDISFTVTTDRYYDAEWDFQIGTLAWVIELELMMRHDQTTIVARPGDFTNIRVDDFIPLFTNDEWIVDDRAELDKYVIIKALPADANLIVKDANMTLSTGRILFKIVADKYYDGDADLITTYPSEFIIGLQLGIKYPPTTITSIYGYDQSENVKVFAQKIKTLTGDALKTYLATYVKVTGGVPAGAIMSIDTNNVVYDEETGKVSFNILMDQYYDANSYLKTNGRFLIRLKLAF